MFQKGGLRLVEPARKKSLFIFAVDLRLKSRILRTPFIQKRPQSLVYRSAFYHLDNSLCNRGFSRYNTGMIKRKALFQSIEKALKRSRAVALIGPRQCGKTTLARQFLSPESKNYFDLENPFSLARLDQPVIGTERFGIGRLRIVVDALDLAARTDLFLELHHRQEEVGVEVE